MAKRGGGYNLCAALYCNHNRKRNPNLSFFRFPKNPKVCRQWVINSKRFDLLNKEPSYLYANCIMCADHFEDNLFTHKIKNRLLDHAVPTKFPIGDIGLQQESPISECEGEEICEQVEKQMKEASPGIVIKGKKPVQKPERMILSSIFKESKELLSTKTVTFSTPPRIIRAQIPESSISSANIVSLPNSSKVTSVNPNDKPRLIWLTGLPMSQKPATAQSSLVKTVLPNMPVLGTANVPILGSSVANVPLSGKTIIPGVESSVCLLPEVKREIAEIPGTSESNNDNFAPSDYSYAGSYDGSQYPSSVLLDSTNNQDGGSQDNTFDTSYDDSSAPPPFKRKRPCGDSTDQLKENYMAFSELVVSKLKSLPPHRAALLQLKIQKLLSQEIVSLESEGGDEGTEDDAAASDLNEEEEEVEGNGQTGPGPCSEAAADKSNPSARPEDCPNGAEDKNTAQSFPLTSSSSVTTIAKKRKSRGRQSENKENLSFLEESYRAFSKVILPFLEESYRAFSKCIISQLRYLPTAIAVQTQNKIQKVLSDEIVEFYTKKDLHSNEQNPDTDSSHVRIKEEPIDNMES
uniref:52 kDa repressor of the inhibitor of the protein kinase n=2 Tax=Cacopsylla melanoneura TaxID=428564 RepID=A0A8D8TFG5_9HEMI